MTPHLIFDGYNLIYSPSFSRNYRKKDTSIQARREHLVQLISSYLGGKKIRGTIVFDSPNHAVVAPVIGGSSKLRVVFASANENADERIVKLALELKDRFAITAVSSDEAHIGSFLRGCGICVLKSEDFWQRIFKGKQPSAPRVEEAKPTSLTKTELAYWEKIFSEKNKP